MESPKSNSALLVVERDLIDITTTITRDVRVGAIEVMISPDTTRITTTIVR